MWFRKSNRYFCKIENFAYGEISERSFSNPHPISAMALSRNIEGILHGDVIKWKPLWPFVQGIHRSPVSSPHKGQWRGALMCYLIHAWMNGWVKRWITPVLIDPLIRLHISYLFNICMLWLFVDKSVIFTAGVIKSLYSSNLSGHQLNQYAHNFTYCICTYCWKVYILTVHWDIYGIWTKFSPILQAVELNECIQIKTQIRICMLFT